jgi:predicted TIM-barrel fold metal-dependent hydrolase
MIIDIHGHRPGRQGLDVPGFQWRLTSLPDGDISPDDVARILRESAIDRMILSPTAEDMGPTAGQMRSGNRRVAELVRKYPDLFYAYCSVNPHYLPESLEEMEYTVHELGFVGIGEICPHVLDFEIDSREVRAIVEKAVELDVPLNIHSSEPTHFRGLARLAKEYPTARIVMSHLGGFRFWRDGIAAIEPFDNVWTDCSAWVMCTMGAFETAVTTLGARRVLFGTDFPLCELDMAAYKLQHSGLSSADRERVASKNAIELFRLAL